MAILEIKQMRSTLIILMIPPSTGYMLRTADGSGSTGMAAWANSPALAQTGPGCALELYYYLNDTGRSFAFYAKQGGMTSRLFYTNSRTSGTWKRQVAWVGARPAGN